ncbi:hypothetical protein NDU88_003246 [Pleurodeles waltl]|uniref:Uncharacterized protein n=1 Tax=Pleurodeles waltl TaxID=8319 RepID=A0AAV7W5I0_PLEWA|nr:hypothetical protein NDU88_003246 [Pleurodeles waltl]
MRISTTTRQGATTEVKHGSGEKTSVKAKNTSLDRFFEKSREIAPEETGMMSSLVVLEQSVPIETGSEAGLPSQEVTGGSEDHNLDVSQLKNYATGNQVDLMNNSQTDMTPTHLEAVRQQQRSPGRNEASNSGSPTEDLVNLANESLINNGKMEMVRLTIPRDKEMMQSDTFVSLSDHSSWSSNEQLDFAVDKISSEPNSETSSLMSIKNYTRAVRVLR